jgi:rhomboid protease GluP
MSNEPVASPPTATVYAPRDPPQSAFTKLGIPPVVLVLILANVAMFCVEVALGADVMSPTAPKMITLGADFAPLTLHGEPWRLVSSMFLHFGIIHLAMNMLCLYQGRVVEHAYGPAGFAALYLVAGLAGSVASMARSSHVVSAGASGAVFGVFGAFGAFLWMRRDRLDPTMAQKSARSLGSFVAINFFYGMTTAGIDMTAHIGGLLGGFASGVALLAGRDAPRGTRAIGVAVAGVVLAIAAVFVIPTITDGVTPSKFEALLKRFDDVETKAITKYNDLFHQSTSNTLTDLQFADAMERDVLPPWQALRKDLEATTEVPPESAPAFTRIVRYVKLREEAWLLLVKLLRDPTHTSDDEKAFAEKSAAVDEAVRDFKEVIVKP